MNLKERYTKLKNLLNEYSYQYHVLDNPAVEDSIYDSLFIQLKQIEKENPELITKDSPTQRVGNIQSDGFEKVVHSKRMLSLNDVFEFSEISKWVERITKINSSVENADYWGDIKMDGLACSLIYDDGELQTAVTRGDGFVGENVTSNVKTIQSVPLQLRGSTKFNIGRTEIRGEIVMYKNEFDLLNLKLSKAGEKTYANPRNLAAGTIRQLDPSIAASRPLVFRAYDIMRDNQLDIVSQEFAYKTIKDLGFLINQQAKKLKSIKDIQLFCDEWREKRHELPFNTDGLVIKINNRQLYESLGVVGKNPRAAIAFKYPAEQATTVLKDIVISIGRTGAATPVAVLEPVVVAGSTVQMATLHNEDEIIRKEILIGDTVIIHKAGDIIPEVVEPIKSLRNGSEKQFVMPERCPDCETKFVKPEGEVVSRCPNNSCPARTWRHIQHFASKSALDIDGMGEKNVMALLDAELISDSADIYKLTKDNLLDLERFADLSSQNLIEAISAKKNPPLSKFIFALGIRHVGAQTAIDLANNFKTLDNISKASVEELNEVEGVGVVVAESIATWFSDEENIKLLLKFKENGVVPISVKEITDGPLIGKSFVITGSLNSMSRETAADQIRELGGTFQSSVGKGTTYLVAGGSIGASKLAKAEKFGTEIIDEQKFLKMINFGGA